MATFLTAEWRKLIFFNYAVPESLLLPFLPAHTVLDTWHNTHYISLVGFLFKDTILKGWRIPFHRTFPEINLRFYVKRQMPDGTWRRGTVFIKEVVPKLAISLVANWFYKEHYETLPMRYEHRTDFINYGLKKANQWQELSVNFAPEPLIIHPESDIAFITEHYFGYNALHATKTIEYQVTHPIWTHFKILNSSLNFDFSRVYGSTFEGLTKSLPESILLAEGSEVSVLSRSIIE